MPLHVVQLQHERLGRRVALVDEPQLVMLDGPTSAFALAREAIEQESPAAQLVQRRRSEETLDYDQVHRGESDWKLLPAFDHPDDPLHCIVSGTGLTHRASAENREKMHQAESAGDQTDSMRLYAWGVEGGRPAPGEVGVQPEWFYKGTGAVLRAHGHTLRRPAFADDGGEEPEVVGAYIIDGYGRPWRVGLAAGNEFADHVMEKKNYLYLAHSKIRECAIGPELALDAEFQDIAGTVTIRRGGDVVWSAEIHTGERHMAHSLANLEHHHFKYPQHRQPWQAHVHFLGADAFSFGAQQTLENGDVMEVAWRGLGRPLRNELQVDVRASELVEVAALAPPTAS